MCNHIKIIMYLLEESINKIFNNMMLLKAKKYLDNLWSFIFFILSILKKYYSE